VAAQTVTGNFIFMALPSWRKRYTEIYTEYFKIAYPTAWASGHIILPKYPAVAKANGLTMFVTNLLKWTGNHGERTNTMGRPIEKTAPRFNILSGQIEQIANGIEWQKGTGTKGSSDIKGHINVKGHTFPIPVYIEIKAGKDRMSDDQKEYQKSVTSTGALYAIVKTPEDFYNFYDYCMGL
jgi:hypothetical protein